MTCKFNSGRGAHICDRCRVMICEGSLDHPKRLVYCYSVPGPEQHWLVSKSVDTTGWACENDSGYSIENPWKHSREYCPECAVVVAIEHDVHLITAKELYKL